MPVLPAVVPSGLTSEVLQALLQTADLGQVGISVVAVDVDPPEYIFVSPGLAGMLGYTVEELVHIPMWELFRPAEIPEMRERQQQRLRAADGSTQRFELWLRKKDGATAPFDVTTSAVRVGGRPANVSFMQDVSDRFEALDALAASEARFRTAVESAPDGVVILRGPTISYANSRAAVLLGAREPEDVVGRAITEFIVPEDAQRAAQRIGELYRTQQRFAEPAEYRCQHADGTVVSVEISSIPIEFEGRPAVLAFARDVTERNAMHEKMVQADRLAAVGTLAAGIAHEINNPLAYVLLGLQYLERELPKLALDPARLHDALARLSEVRNGAERVGNIVRDLKTFARADEVARGPVDLYEVLEAALKIADNEIRHRATLVRNYQRALPVDANAARLEQVFLNLLVNAAHAVSDRDPATSEISVAIRPHGEEAVAVEVTDNGSGIPSAVLRRVFDPFFTTKPVGVGTGLGLPICRNIVESFGGQIELESTPGESTVARVVLPVYVNASPAGRTAPPARAPSSPPGGRTRILIVDDEPLVTGLLRRMLASNHDVAVATSGNEALRAIDENDYDAIVCDVMMPGMTGMDLYQAIRARGGTLARRMIFMTGGAFVPRVAEFLTTVENPKLEKPFDLDALALALRRIAEKAAEEPASPAVEG